MNITRSIETDHTRGARAPRTVAIVNRRRARTMIIVVLGLLALSSGPIADCCSVLVATPPEHSCCNDSCDPAMAAATAPVALAAKQDGGPAWRLSGENLPLPTFAPVPDALVHARAGAPPVVFTVPLRI
jgi:hypothetical protein